MTLDAATVAAITALIAATSGVAGGAAGFWLKQKLALNADKRTDRQIEDDNRNKAYEYVIDQLTTQNEKLERERKEQISQLSTKLDMVTDRERECVKVQEGLRVQTVAQQEDIESLKAELQRLLARMNKVDGDMKT